MPMCPLTSGDAPGARAPALRGLGRRVAHALIARQPEVVVRAQQQHLAPVERHLRPLRALDRAQLAVQRGVDQGQRTHRAS